MRANALQKFCAAAESASETFVCGIEGLVLPGEMRRKKGPM
jgi:hypothetical protein